LKSPHILLAASNVRKMLENIRHLLDPNAVQLLVNEINRNGIGLFRLGHQHYRFAVQIDFRFWRQKVSRLYYSVYNVRRAVVLIQNGVYNTDLSDHKNVGELPADFPNRETYTRRFTDLRNDRNLADYSHDASKKDLVISPSEAEDLARQFLKDARSYLRVRGVRV